MTQISSRVYQLAQGVAQQTGLHTNVVLAQWISEEGGAGMRHGQWSNFGNNPAGISYGNPYADALSNGRTSGGFLAFPSRQAGAQAYADMYLYDPNYPGVRATFGKSPQSQLSAIAASPWDAGHYGGHGQFLFSNYNSLTGLSLSPGSSNGGGANVTSTSNPNSPASFFQTLHDEMKLNSFSLLNPLAGGRAVALRASLFLFGLILVIFGLVAVVKNTGVSIPPEV